MSEKKPSPTMFNVFVVFQHGPEHYPVRNYGNQTKPLYEAANLGNDGRHGYDCFSHEKIGAIVLALHERYSTIQQIIVLPDREWRQWLGLPEDEAGEGKGGGSGSSGCEGSYLMSY